MKIKYTVHSVTVSPASVTAIVAGQEVEAKVDMLVIELVSADGGMGHTFRLMPSDLEAEQEEYAVGAEVELTLAVTAPAPAPVAEPEHTEEAEA